MAGEFCSTAESYPVGLPAADLISWEKLADDSVKNAKIIVVDDDDVILGMLRHHLGAAGHHNVITTNESATAFARIHDELPDIILLDIRMAVCGLQLLAMIRGEDVLKRIPIVVLTAATDPETKLTALELGANDFLTKPVDVGELLARVRNNLLVKQHFDQLARYSEQLEKEVYVDALTQTGNRRAFEKELQQRLREWHVAKKPLSLLLIDIDHFKKVNDCYGHRAGDKLLRSLAQVIQDQLGPEAVLCRYGGEELTVLLSDVTADGAREIAETIRTTVEKHIFAFEDLQLTLRVSIGVTGAIPRDKSAIIFQRTDSALYASKQSGRNCCHFHDGNNCARVGDASHAMADPLEDEPSFAKPTTGELTQAKIMLVDDEPVMIMTLRKHLKDGGFCHFVTCEQAEKAVATIRREQPDVVLLDVRMPKISGLEILSEIRGDETIQYIPVIVLTSSTDENTKSEALQLGAYDFLAKPVNVSELLSTRPQHTAAQGPTRSVGSLFTTA